MIIDLPLKKEPRFDVLVACPSPSFFQAFIFALFILNSKGPHEKFATREAAGNGSSAVHPGLTP